jgi:hypothetical protein
LSDTLRASRVIERRKRRVRWVRAACALVVALGLVAIGVGSLATLTWSTGGAAAAVQPKICSLLTSLEITDLLGGSSAGGQVTGDTAATCAYQSPTTGAEFAVDRSTVGAGNSLKREQLSEIAGSLDCTASKLQKVTGKGGEFGYYCGAPTSPDQPAAMAIQMGSVSLSLQATVNTTKASCLAAANTIFRELRRK